MLDCGEARRWIAQALYTLDSIRVDIEGGFYAWACFKAHQAAEYALKAVLRGAGAESFGHDLPSLWRGASRLCPGLSGLWECVALLNKMYIPPRYPDAWPGGGVPFESFTRRDALESLECASRIVGEARRCVGEACGEGAP